MASQKDVSNSIAAAALAAALTASRSSTGSSSRVSVTVIVLLPAPFFFVVVVVLVFDAEVVFFWGTETRNSGTLEMQSRCAPEYDRLCKISTSSFGNDGRFGKG